jgi:glycosyltransferase involved in cell wall biosynthesis
VGTLGRVIILCHALRAGGGISVGKNFVAALKRRCPQTQFWITVPANLGYESFIGEDRTQFIVFEHRSYLQLWFFENLELPQKARMLKPDVIICLGNRALPWVYESQLLLVHDSHLFYPVSYYATESRMRKLLKAYQRKRFSRDLLRIDALLVQTETAASRVVKQFDYSGKVIHVPNAISVSIDSHQHSDLPAVFERHASATRLFYLARYYPHKNIELIVEAFERYPERLGNCRVFLTIGVDQHVAAGRLLARIASSGLENSIINLGPLEQEDLGSYFQHSDALIMPTTLESFSGTYIEALAFGTPILTSDLDFAHEICGDAAIYFDPWSAESLCAAVEKLEADPVLAKRLVDIGRGRLESLQWDWDSNAQRIVDHLTISLDIADS